VSAASGPSVLAAGAAGAFDLPRPAQGPPPKAAAPTVAIGTALLLLPALVFLGATFLAPLARLVMLSFSASEGAFAAYREILGDDIYRHVFLNTFAFAVLVTAVAIAIGYPLALALTA
jgi:putative spermidine/putrescine transport system permease protein